MKKITLSILALYIGVLAVFSQSKPNSDSAYRQRKLTFAEANIVSSYYSQDPFTADSAKLLMLALLYDGLIYRLVV
jgi:hypothetical protein